MYLHCQHWKNSNHISLFRAALCRAGPIYGHGQMRIVPIYQMMRLQLLAGLMEQSRKNGSGEMNADIVSVLHVSPCRNLELRNTITIPRLKGKYPDIYTLWEDIAPEDRFHHIDSGKLLDVATTSAAPDGFDDWRDWMRRRYL